jgi:CRISPR-associated protein Csm2
MGQRRPPQDQPRIELPSDRDLGIIIRGEDVESAKLTVEWGKKLGKHLKRDLKSSQIRGIFGQVRQIEMNWPSDIDDPQQARAAERELILLKPKLAYQAERVQGVSDLAELLSAAIDQVQGNRKYFQRFVDFFEAVLAYHKAEGGN